MHGTMNTSENGVLISIDLITLKKIKTAAESIYRLIGLFFSHCAAVTRKTGTRSCFHKTTRYQITSLKRSVSWLTNLEEHAYVY